MYIIRNILEICTSIAHASFSLIFNYWQISHWSIIHCTLNTMHPSESSYFQIAIIKLLSQDFIKTKIKFALNYFNIYVFKSIKISFIKKVDNIIKSKPKKFNPCPSPVTAEPPNTCYYKIIKS